MKTKHLNAKPTSGSDGIPGFRVESKLSRKSGQNEKVESRDWQKIDEFRLHAHIFCMKLSVFFYKSLSPGRLGSERAWFAHTTRFCPCCCSISAPKARKPEPIYAPDMHFYVSASKVETKSKVEPKNRGASRKSSRSFDTEPCGIHNCHHAATGGSRKIAGSSDFEFRIASRDWKCVMSRTLGSVFSKKPLEIFILIC